jgi:hypothetical protein
VEEARDLLYKESQDGGKTKYFLFVQRNGDWISPLGPREESVFQVEAHK